MTEDLQAPEAVAVIGMAGRFPGAQNPDEFWQNLIAGKDGITRFPGRTEPDGSKYVGARSMFENPDKFDATFFGIYPKEAELMDPQHRVFLECSWEALEGAGYDPAAYPGMIGVYAGLSLNTYLLHNLGKGRELAKNYQVAEYQTMLGNDKDFLPVRVSYKLNLRGPSMTIQSACSTSLVAICQAATALLTYQCDMALTGGVSISFPQQRDYLFQEEGMVSPDGTCRAFDADAAGTVFGHGCGAVLLKRLSEAIADRDPILAVIKGWAVNNDGSDKIGFAAPGLKAQADVIALAQASAGVSPSEISYVEAHGTGTPLDDPIEVAALTKAFREGGAEENSFCALGTGKTHIGHLDCAAGVTGLIKTIQQFRHEKIHALLHFKSPNPRIDFSNSPFSPVSADRDWKRGETPRLAGVSAFGVGGGMPSGVLAGKKQYMDALDGGAWNYGDDSFPEVGVTFFAGTFVRHPLALAAAWRVVEHLIDEGPRLQIDMEERVSRFCRTLSEHFEVIGVPIRLPHFSAYAVIEHAPDLKYASLLWYFVRENGVHVWEGRPLYFTTAHTDEDLDHVTRAFIEAVAKMQAAGFLPASPEVVGEAPVAFPRFDSAPTTEAQREIFHAVQMGDDANCSFNESNIIRLDGALDTPALKAALNDLIVRHPALRSTFSEDGSRQYFHPSGRTVEIMEHDFSSTASHSPTALLPLSLIKNAESSIPFDLTHGPLFRLHLVSLSAERHELIFTAHHLVCDGWSFGMILAELATAYNARKAGRLPKLPPAMSFAEYARLEESAGSSADVIAAESFWVNKFTNGAPVLELPTDRPRPQVKSYAGAMEAMTLDSERYARLKKASPKLGGTLFATLLSSFATLLHRITGQDDLVIGVPSAGQTRVGRDELIDHCLNFLPLRLQPAGGRAFREFAVEVKEQVLEAYDHQNYTFGSLLQKLTLPRDTSRLPLVSVMFNIDKSGIDQIHLDGLKIDAETSPKQFVNFDLFFNLVQTDERLIVECEYNTDLHDKATIRRWLGAFEQLIESVIADGETPLAALPILGAEERILTLETWNATARDYPRAATLHSLVSAKVGEVPTRNAVRCRDEVLTYAALESSSNALAARLQASGVKRGHLVGIHLERSCAIATGLLAILKCGAAYVPMDPAFPAERLGFMVEDAHMSVIVSQSSIHRELPQSNAKVLLVDETSNSPGSFTPVESAPEDTAYVIFTSGATGRPKGVRIPHRAVVNFLNSMRREPGLTPDDILLSVTTLSFDISGLEIFLPLTTGAETVIATRETTLDGQLLADAITRRGITVLQATPATWRLLLESGWPGKSDLKILIGGEAVPRDLVNRLAPLCREIWNVYGPTETTIWSTVARLGAGEGPVLIGHPIDNTQVYIVNPALQPQPVGIAGELLIGGAGLASGYHELPELTADRFIDSPFRPGAKLYRTGDLARWTADGSLECLGRMDHQVKVRGFRIELGEIETLLEKHPAVEQAVASVHDGRLVAYLRNATRADGTAIWQDQWDLLYQSAIDQTGSEKLDRLDSVIAGWAGAENIEDQVTEWIDTTIDRIQTYDARRIFEIGCGTGQILARLAATSECYWAADISKVAIEALEKNHPLPQVKLFHRPADDFSGIPDAHFDTVIINSVAQYFPNAAYLSRVLEGAARILKPGGRIFLGDLQGNALLATHHAEALHERAPAGMTAGQLRESVVRRVAHETELSVDPAWFESIKARIPSVTHTETLLRRGKISNETTRYYYDAILHKHPAPGTFEVPEPVEWRNLNLEQLEAMLDGSKANIHLTGIPDARLAPAIGFHHALQSAPADAPLPAIPATPLNAVTAEELFNLAEQAGFKAHVRWHGDGAEGLLDVVFSTHETLPDWKTRTPSQPASSYTNTPHAAASATGDLAPALRRHLASHLPDYMIPAVFVALDSFPLTPNGKVDRKALPAPSEVETLAAPRWLVGARNEAEGKLLDIWKQVLGKDHIGVEDDIFELGGDSILIFQITTRATRAGLAVTPAQVFRLRNVAALAAASSAAQKPLAAAIQAVNRDAYRRKF